MDFRGQRFQRVIRRNRYFHLPQDAPPIHLRIHFVYRAAGDGHARLEGLLDAVQPRKRRQQAGVEVDDAPSKSIQKSLGGKEISSGIIP